MKKLTVRILGITIVLGIAGFLALKVPPVQDVVLTRLTERLTVPSDPASGEALVILFCGTGGPFPDKDRAGPCTLVIAGDKRFLVDSGTGGVQRLQQMGVALGELKGVFYTHLHSDHIAGLGDVLMNSWVGGRKEALTLYGPPGVEDLGQGFETAFGVDSQSRIDHHGAEIFEPEAKPVLTQLILVPNREEAVVVYEEDGLKVTAFRVTHEPLANAYGYRFDYKGRSVVFSGDTVKDDNMVRFGENADVMIHEAMSMVNMRTIIDALKVNNNMVTAQILTDASEVHTSPIEAAEIANAAGVKLLVYNHIVPPMPVSMMKDRFLRGVSDIRAEGVKLSHDGLLIRLPANSDLIHTENLN